MLADDVADNAGAVTRFVLLTPPGPPPAPTGDDRTTLAATTQNRPGSLLGLLTELAVRGIDLTRIESRPIKDRHAEYWFHLDCTGHIAEPAMGEALAALHRRCDRVRFLGSYPRAGRERHGRRRRRRAGRSRARHRRRRRSRPRERWLDRPARRERSGVRLVLARHGRTAANVAHVLDSRPPGAPLDERRAARRREELARRLAGQPGRAPCYASRAIRAQQTAAPVAAAHGLAVEVVDGVQEVSVGDLEGRSDAARLEAFDEVYDAWWRGELDARLPGGESALDLRARFLPARGAARRRRTTATSSLVSHGAAIRLAAGALLGDTAETCYVPNAGPGGAAPRAGPAGRWSTGTRAEPVRGDVTGGRRAGLTAPAAGRRAVAASPSPARAGCPRRCRSGGRPRAPRSPRPRATTSSSVGADVEDRVPVDRDPVREHAAVVAGRAR